MKLQNTVRHLVQFSLFTMVMTFGLVPSAYAISFNLSWTGNSGTKLTGTFEGTANNDGLIGTVNGINSITAFNVTFTDYGNNPPVTYNLSDLNSPTSSPNFNFIYDTNSGKVLQFGDPLTSTGFSIGLDSGYLLESTSTNGITFTDLTGQFNNDSGVTGSLNATPVPFESSPVAPLTVLPILGLMGFYRQRQRLDTPRSKDAGIL
ncbi:MAG: hypothetical protein HEQ33_06255 [Dolichospermum sp. WA123]|nr:hypothetical protein [Dolichospermum sp. WA123]